MNLPGIYISEQVREAVERLYAQFTASSKEWERNNVPPSSCTSIGQELFVVEKQGVSARPQPQKILVASRASIVGSSWAGGNDPISRVYRMQSEPPVDRERIIYWPKVVG
jgi:hypothetical protein